MVEDATKTGPGFSEFMGDSEIRSEFVLSPEGRSMLVQTTKGGFGGLCVLKMFDVSPMEYETIVWADRPAEMHHEGYSSQDGARAGHGRIVESIRSGALIPCGIAGRGKPIPGIVGE